MSFNIVMTVVNLVSKRIYFILMYITITVKNTVRLFLHNMWKLLLQLISQGYNIEMGLGYDDTIGCAKVVSVSASCNRCSSLAVSLLSPHGF